MPSQKPRNPWHDWDQNPPRRTHESADMFANEMSPEARRVTQSEIAGALGDAAIKAVRLGIRAAQHLAEFIRPNPDK